MIHKSVLLPCGQPRAFTLFTERITDWWPPDRRHTSDTDSQLFLVESGRFWERARDGNEVELGRVRLWQAPHRLILDFYVGTDADHPSEVEIAFAAEGEGTRVSVMHRATPASAALFDQRASKFDRSWDLVLAALAAFSSP